MSAETVLRAAGSATSPVQVAASSTGVHVIDLCKYIMEIISPYPSMRLLSIRLATDVILKKARLGYQPAEPKMIFSTLKILRRLLFVLITVQLSALKQVFRLTRQSLVPRLKFTEIRAVQNWAMRLRWHPTFAVISLI